MLSLSLVAICLGYFMVILDTTIVKVALPALREDFGTSVSGLQWVVDGYLLMFAALLLSMWDGIAGCRCGGRSNLGWVLVTVCIWPAPGVGGRGCGPVTSERR
ncbi:MAG: hypothetical protein WCC38_10345 [Pseudonocardiaceae bacterium]